MLIKWDNTGLGFVISPHCIIRWKTVHLLFTSSVIIMDKKAILLDQVKEVMRLHDFSYKTEQSYTDWIYRFLVYHDPTHPQDMDAKEISAFLTFLAVGKKFSASTHNQALN